MFLVFYQYHSNVRTWMYGQDAFEPDGEKYNIWLAIYYAASVATEVVDVGKTLRTSCRLLFEYIYVLYSCVSIYIHRIQSTFPFPAPSPIEFPLKIKYTMIYESIYPPEINFGSFMEERTSICIS